MVGRTKKNRFIYSLDFALNQIAKKIAMTITKPIVPKLNRPMSEPSNNCSTLFSFRFDNKFTSDDYSKVTIASPVRHLPAIRQLRLSSTIASHTPAVNGTNLPS